MKLAFRVSFWSSFVIGLWFLLGRIVLAAIDLPPEGVYFKLENFQSMHWIYSNLDGRFGHYRGGDYNDQYWTIILGTGQYEGYFKLENYQSKYWIYSANELGHHRGNDNPNQYWKIIKGQGTRQGYFKLENYQTKKWIYSNSDGRFNHYRGGDYSDQYWRFVYRDREIGGVCILNYDTLPPQETQVPRILNQLGAWKVPLPPGNPVWQGGGDAPNLENPWELEPVVRFLSCYQVILKDGSPVTEENCYAMVNKEIWKHQELATVKDAYWFPWVDKCSELRDAGIIGGGIATLATGVDLQIKFTKNKNEAQLKLTTSSEQDTAELLILRGHRLENGGTEIEVACQFESGDSPYICTDQPVADTYRVVEKEYDGHLIVYDEEVVFK